GGTLSEAESRAVMEEIMEGRATDAQIAAFLVALRMKGETVGELVGAAKVMREKATKVPIGVDAVDTCGTGGDGAGTFNISTVAAFVVAGAGVPVAKHGNRSVSSRCGSADLLEALGVRLDLPPEGMARCVEEVGIGFLFAPLLHRAMKHAIGPRREIGIRTLFNLLGPITNPAGVRRQVLGVYSTDRVEQMAEVLKGLGAKRALVVHGDGMDEATLCGPTLVGELKDGEVHIYQVVPEDFGFRRAEPRELSGGDASTNAEIAERVLKGERGPKRNVVVLNAGAAIWIGGKASSWKEGVQMAQEAIEGGMAWSKVEELREFTRGWK
ncbi:MAG: anthranilate phosphoribosyltransferase, partial [Candidatus Latescibacterota bacterium]